MAGIHTLFPETSVLASQQIKHQSRMFVNQGQKTGAIQPYDGKRCQGLGITTVVVTRFNEIAIKKQFARAITDSAAWGRTELNQAALHHENCLYRFTASIHECTCRKGQQVAFRMIQKQLKRGGFCR